MTFLMLFWAQATGNLLPTLHFLHPFLSQIFCREMNIWGKEAPNKPSATASGLPGFYRICQNGNVT